MVKTARKVTLFIIAAILFPLLLAQKQPTISSLTLGQSIVSTPSDPGYIYYSSTFKTTKKLLAITLNPNQESPFTQFLSLNDPNSNQPYTKYPNETNYTHKCAHTDLNTCILDLSDVLGNVPNRNVTIYFSILASESVAYFLQMDLIDQIPLQTHFSQLSFAKSSAAVLKVNASEIEQLSNAALLLTYSKVGGQFEAIAGFDSIPHSSINQGVYVIANQYGAYRQLLPIPVFGNVSDIYVLISSQKGSVIDVQLIQLPPQLELNSTISYKTTQTLNYTVNLSPNAASNTNNTLNITDDSYGSIYIQLSAFTGYGSFTIDYCEGLSDSFESTNGMSFQMIISPLLRSLCLHEGYQDQIVIVISIENPFAFGYQIGLYQYYTDQPLLINQQIMSYSLINESIKNYPLSLPLKSYTYFINYSQFMGVNQTYLINNTDYLQFSLQQCQIKHKNTTCTTISNGSQVDGQFIFTAQTGFTYELIVENSLIDIEGIPYQIFLGYDQVNATYYSQGKESLQEIALREYKFYHINVTSAKLLKGIKTDDTQVNITVKTLNGNVDFLTSLTIADPSITQFMTNTSQITFNTKNTISYIVNKSTQIIYLSIYGQDASIFTIQFTLNQNFDLPARYKIIEDDISNTFTINSTHPYQLFTYSSHIRPYSITVDGSPKCIRFGYTLPLPPTCYKQLPPLLYEKNIYLNISNGASKNAAIFTVTASSGYHQLNNQNVIIVSCIQACYNLINVTLEADSRVIMKGKGQIKTTDNTSQSNLKDTLTLTCNSYPCLAQINASLPYGGAMSIYVVESHIQYMNGTMIPFINSQLPKNVLLPIKSATDINNVIVRSDGQTLVAKYMIFAIDNRNQNILNINFTELPNNLVALSAQDSLRNVLIVSIPQSAILKLNCGSTNIYCIAAISLFADHSVPFNLLYSRLGTSFIASNTDIPIKLPINEPIGMNSTLQINGFQFENIDNYSDAYRVDIDPWSNCHPVILYNDSYIEHQYRYGPIIFNNPQQPIKFSVLTQDACLYIVTFTNSAYKTIFTNKYYTLPVQNGQITVILIKPSSQLSFNILAEPIGQEKIDYILANRMINTYDSIVAPTINSHSFMSVNSSTLDIRQQKEYDAYTIRIMTKNPSIRLIVKIMDYIILTNNEEISVNIQPSTSQTYAFFSKQSISIYLQSLHGVAQVSIAKKSQILKETTVNGSKQIQINQDSQSQDIVDYAVKITNNQLVPLKISMKFTQNIKYLKELYEGVILYDAFTVIDKNNCYNYKAPLEVGREKVVLDLVLNGEKYGNCSCFDLLYNISIKGMTNNVAQKALKSNLVKLNSSLHAYRIEMTFLADQEYTFCLSTPNQSVIFKQYYLIVHSPILKHIIAGEDSIKYIPEELDLYQIIEEEQSQDYAVQLTLCDPYASNDKTVLGSSVLFEQTLQSYTNLAEYHKNDESVFGRLTVNYGYYFLAVKSQQLSTSGAYSLKLNSIGSDNKILSSVWSLQSKEIANITIDSHGHIIITLPKLISFDNVDEQNNITLTYNILILNMTNPSASNATNQSNIGILSRCPNYVSSKSTHPFAKQEIQPLVLNKTLNMTYSDLQELQDSHDQFVLIFKQTQIPQKFNITGRVDIKVNSQAYSYYYNTKYMDLSTSTSYEGNESNNGTAIVAIVVILLIALVGGGIYGYIRYKRHTSKQTVSFELANFGQNSAVVERNQGLITTPKEEEKEKKGYYVMEDEAK